MSWDTLFTSIAAVTERERSAEAARAAEAAELAAFQAWSERVSGLLVQELQRVASVRAAELEQRTGLRVEVQRLVTQGSFPYEALALLHGRVEVDIYTYRGPGSLPFVHFLRRPRHVAGERARPERLVSLPGAFVARTGEDSWELRRVRLPGEPPESCVPVSVDELVYRGFELLLAGLRELPMNVTTPAASPPPGS